MWLKVVIISSVFVVQAVGWQRMAATTTVRNPKLSEPGFEKTGILKASLTVPFQTQGITGSLKTKRQIKKQRLNFPAAFYLKKSKVMVSASNSSNPAPKRWKMRHPKNDTKKSYGFPIKKQWSGKRAKHPRLSKRNVSGNFTNFKGSSEIFKEKEAAVPENLLYRFRKPVVESPGYKLSQRNRKPREMPETKPGILPIHFFKDMLRSFRNNDLNDHFWLKIV